MRSAARRRPGTGAAGAAATRWLAVAGTRVVAAGIRLAAADAAGIRLAAADAAVGAAAASMVAARAAAAGAGVAAAPGAVAGGLRVRRRRLLTRPRRPQLLL